MSRIDSRAALGLPAEGKFALILYESETEFDFLSSLVQLGQAYDRLVIVPVTPHAGRQLVAIASVYLNEAGAIIIDDVAIGEAVADDVVLFRYNENLARGRGLPVKIIDPRNRWLTNELTVV